MRRYQEFQKRQVQSLLELREAQVDTEAERRLEHLRQVRWACGSKGQPVSWTDLASALVTCWPPVSVGSAAAQGDCPGFSHNSVQEAEGDEREVRQTTLARGRGGQGTRWCYEERRAPRPAIDPFSAPTGSSREKKELQKILDRKRHNSISEAKTREKHKKEA